MATPIFKIKHPDAGFRGFVAGIDFHGGVGSTSSPEDIVRLLDLRTGYKLIDATPEMKAILAAERGRKKAEGEAPTKISDVLNPTGSTWSAK